MEIVFVNTAMAFGPNTPQITTLGGSETAVLMAAKAVKKLGHIVNIFTPLPPVGSPDYIESGSLDEDGIRFIDYENFASFIGSTEVDLLIVCRDPRAIATTSHAKKRVLWMHDIATHKGMANILDQMAWTFDEIWTVSEWHRQQVHGVTGYPLKNIIPLRNGIVPVDIMDPPFRLDKTLVYAARPERGLANLLKEGGVMEHLPDYTLKLAMYQNSNHDLQQFYAWCMERCEALPNVEPPEALSQPEMRLLLADATAYIYPTQFEETSCILARECIEQRTPFITTREGALPESLGDCGVFFEDYLEKHKMKEPEKGSKQWCEMFAGFFRWAMEEEEGIAEVVNSISSMRHRRDLYWDEVGEMMIANADPLPVTRFSRAWSLVQDGDVIPAYKLLKDPDGENVNWAEERLLFEIEEFYPFILDENDPRYESLSSYYKRYYDFKGDDLEVTQEALDMQIDSPRYKLLVEELSKLSDGATVIEYGCGEGHVVVPMALKFPKLNFIAFDQVQANVDRLFQYPFEGALPNLEAYRADTPQEAGFLIHQDMDDLDRRVDAAICFEVLEHCAKPWEVAQGIEAMVKPGGKMIVMTPYGPWEPQTWANISAEYGWRNHIWHFDKTAIRHMFSGKPDMRLCSVGQGTLAHDGRALGNHFYHYTVNHEPYQEFDPLKKAAAHRSRQTVAAAIIAYNNEDTILRMLNSINKRVSIVQIAMGPSTDQTLKIIERWEKNNPHIYVDVIDVPKIEAPIEFGGTAKTGYGFDDARNASVEGLSDICDWTLWIDTDEYLAGHLGIYLRNNCLDGYLIPQHHFTVEPRGGEVQIDRPARLFRNVVGYKAKGRIHEHFEAPDGGPGHCFMLPDVDIGHTGYVNEAARRKRFDRNFPFLLWEHEEGSDRKLHPFLWFRDIVHRMRYAASNGKGEMAIALANEGEDYYAEHRSEMASFGAGLPTSLQYLSEIRKLLGIGVPMEVTYKFDDRQAGISGFFLDRAELYDIMGQALNDEFERRTSRYF